MMRSMFSGVSGLRAHQTMMDVVGNNVANVNTPGFKASQATFQEALTQTVQGAAPGGNGLGGTNPIQIGLGAELASVTGVFTQGPTQTTGRNTDLAIQGSGYFVLGQGADRLYTRSGSFDFDQSGALVSDSGLAVMGWMSQNGTVDTTQPVVPIVVPAGQVIEPAATDLVELGGNLSADAAVGDTVVATTTVYDSLGAAHEMVVTFEKTGAMDWEVTAEVAGNTLGPQLIQFDPDGTLVAGPTTLTFSGIDTGNGSSLMSIDVALGGTTPLVQYGGTSSPEVYSANGQEIGFLQGVSIGPDGTVMAQFSNGQDRAVGAIATAEFVNPAGLDRVGSSTFAASANSGAAEVGRPGEAGRGQLTPGALEMSNVDLAREFTNLIIAQRGFQANSRIITASDELLADLVNIRR